MDFSCNLVINLGWADFQIYTCCLLASSGQGVLSCSLARLLTYFQLVPFSRAVLTHGWALRLSGILGPSNTAGPPAHLGPSGSSLTMG